MDFFDKQIETTRNCYREAKKAVDLNEENKESTGTSNVSKTVFWGESIPYKRQKRSVGRFFAILFLLLMTTAVLALMMTTAVLGKGWLSNFLSGDSRHSFTLPIYDTPQLENQYYQPDGRYTAEGVAKAIGPSVVSIVNYSTEINMGTLTGSTGTSQGSGVIISEDGYIVTNAHVVDGDPETTRFMVILYDDTMYNAQLVGSDPKSDIAVIKIAASGLSPARFCDSDSVSVGDEVVAIGSPAGLYGSVTKGIVSGVKRSIKVAEGMREVDCIQVDAAINHGNSGGALLNMWGQVIGITSSKLNSALYDSIGFAITTNEAKPIIEQLIEKGIVTGGVKVGITFRGISPLTAEMYEYPCSGLLIAEISEDSDISNTDLKTGDFITQINGKEVYDLSTVDDALEGAKPGDVAAATVKRISADGERIEEVFEISFILGEDTSATDGFTEE